MQLRWMMLVGNALCVVECCYRITRCLLDTVSDLPRLPCRRRGPVRISRDDCFQRHSIVHCPVAILTTGIGLKRFPSNARTPVRDSVCHHYSHTSWQQCVCALILFVAQCRVRS